MIRWLTTHENYNVLNERIEDQPSPVADPSCTKKKYDGKIYELVIRKTGHQKTY